VVVLTAAGEGKLFRFPESVEGLNEFLGVGQDGDEVGLGAGTGSLAGFALAVEKDGWIGEFFRREAEGGAKEDLGRPAAGQGHEAHAFLEVGANFAGQTTGMRGRRSMKRRLARSASAVAYARRLPLGSRLNGHPLRRCGGFIDGVRLNRRAPNAKRGG
jgi:hypothetical protein